MTNIQDKHIDRFLTLFQHFEGGLNGEKGHPMHEWRRKAIDRLKDLRFPTRRDEEWKYTPVSRVVSPTYSINPKAELSKEQLKKFKIKGLNAAVLTFVNGQLREDLSDLDRLPDGLQLMPMSEALDHKDYQEIVKELYLSSTEKTDDPFLVMNAAFSMESMFIYVPANTNVAQALHILHINTPEEHPYFYNPQKLIHIERGGKMILVESFNDLDENDAKAEYFNNMHNVIHLKGNAQMDHYKLQRESTLASHLNNTSVYQDRDSVYSNYQLDLGGLWVRNNLNAYHKGENVTTNFYGAFLGKGNQHIDAHTLVDHATPHCQSNELYKGILDDKAHGVFNGKVMVHKDAQKTNAFQQNSSLLLSEKAVMDAKPQLEIFADDVKCSHGATIGHLDESSVFFLRTRGINAKRAKEMLQEAFLLDVIDNMTDESLRTYASEWIAEKLASE